MAAISEGAKAIKNLGNSNGSDKMKQLVRITYRTIHHKLAIAATPTTVESNPAISRVLLNNKNNKPHQTRSMTQPTQQFSTVSTPVVLRVEQSMIAKYKIRKEKYIQKKTVKSTTEQAHNTGSRTQQAKTPPYSRTRTRPLVTIMENKK